MSNIEYSQENDVNGVEINIFDNAEIFLGSKPLHPTCIQFLKIQNIYQLPFMSYDKY